VSNTTIGGLEPFRTTILPASLPFSSAIKAGGFVFVSGQIGHHRGQLKLIEGGIEPETRQALEYMKETLELAGSSMEKVVKCTAFIADMADFGKFNEVYRSYFKTHLPARSTVEVKALAMNARIEIECMALA
jgi:reactive intermediate/imine deaminase